MTNCDKLRIAVRFAIEDLRSLAYRLDHGGTHGDLTGIITELEGVLDEQ